MFDILVLLPMLLLLLLALFGYTLLRCVCDRFNPPDGWEESSGEAEKLGRKWLLRHEMEAEDLTVQSVDGFLLHAKLIPHSDPCATAILLHGWHSSCETDFGCALPFLFSIGLQLLLPDERAHGESEGRWITFGARESEDAAVWADELASRFGHDHPILLFGTAMGASAALSAARLRDSVRGVVAEGACLSPYDAFAAAWRRRTGLPSGFVTWMLDLYTRFFAGFSLWEADAAHALSKIQVPVLLIYGTEDGLISRETARRLYEARMDGTELLLIEGARRGRAYLAGTQDMQEAYRSFVRRCLPDNAATDEQIFEN